MENENKCYILPTIEIIVICDEDTIRTSDGEAKGYEFDEFFNTNN